jgi:hypothetical protein
MEISLVITTQNTYKFAMEMLKISNFYLNYFSLLVSLIKYCLIARNVMKVEILNSLRQLILFPK